MTTLLCKPLTVYAYSPTVVSRSVAPRCTISLVAALADQSIAGAGLDVYEKEPHAPDALTAFPNVVLTPHVGGHTLESHVAMQNCVIANLEAFFMGKPLPYPVK